MGWEGVDDAADGRTPRRAARVGDAAGEERRTSVRREEEEEDDDDARGMEASDAPWLPRGVIETRGEQDKTSRRDRRAYAYGASRPDWAAYVFFVRIQSTT